MRSTNAIATPARTTLRIRTVSGDEIEAWVYRPEGEGPHPAIVLAHRFAAVKAGGLAPLAEQFCREGFPAIAFDYRHRGGSTGEPRDEVSVPRQREDYRTVLDWAFAQPDVDPNYIPAGVAPGEFGGHYGTYEGGADYDNVLRVEIEFLHRHVPASAGSGASV